MAERGISLAHTTIMRSDSALCSGVRSERFTLCLLGRHILCGSTKLMCLSKASGHIFTVLSTSKERRWIFCSAPSGKLPSGQSVFPAGVAVAEGRLPQKITLDGYQASHRAAREILGEHQRGKRTNIRSSKYLNNLIGAGSPIDKISFGCYARE